MKMNEMKEYDFLKMKSLGKAANMESPSIYQPLNLTAAAQYSSPTAFADLHPGMGTHDSTRKTVSKRATGAIKISLSNDYNTQPQIH